jgi:hypothetical protein
MSDPNPYESPQSEQPQSEQPQQLSKVAKRVLGAGLILALTPLAVFFTFFITCSIHVVQQLGGPEQDLGGPPKIVMPELLLFGPPTAVLVGMVIWAILVRRRTLLASDARLREERRNTRNDSP